MNPTTPTYGSELLDIATATISEGREWLRARLKRGAQCPLCKQRAQVYKRKLNAGMAYGIIIFFRHVKGDTSEWVHVPTHTDLSRLGGDWAKLSHWKLIQERSEVRDDGGSHAGWWRLTTAGISFVRRTSKVPSHILMYDSRCLRMDDEKMIAITDALGDKFNYDQLMEMPVENWETEGAL